MKKSLFFCVFMVSMISFAQPRELATLIQASTYPLGDTITFLIDQGYSYSQEVIKIKGKKKETEVRTWHSNKNNDTAFVSNNVNQTLSMYMPYNKMVADEITIWLYENLTFIELYEEKDQTILLFYQEGIVYALTIWSETYCLQIQL